MKKTRKWLHQEGIHYKVLVSLQRDLPRKMICKKSAEFAAKSRQTTFQFTANFCREFAATFCREFAATCRIFAATFAATLPQILIKFFRELFRTYYCKQ
jgi:hypothetical protein